MHYRPLGTTGISVSSAGFGCGDLAGSAKYGLLGAADAGSLVRTALAWGMNYFDTAEAYGNGASERLLGRALKDVSRDTVILSSKIMARGSAADMIAACEGSLTRLKTDYLDLCQVHWPAAGMPAAEIMTALEKLRQSGKIRSAGVCNYGRHDLAALDSGEVLVNNQLPYSLLFRAIEFDILAACRDRGMTVTCCCPLMMGLLSGKYRTADEVPDAIARTRHFASTRPLAKDHHETGWETETFNTIAALHAIAAEEGLTLASLALAWLLHQEGVASVLSGPRTLEEVRQNAAAAEIRLSRALLDWIDTATASLKMRLGPNADMWRSTPRMR